MIVAGTGHRPKDILESSETVGLKTRVKLKKSPKIDTVITGMAEGFDIILGIEARDLGLKVIAARPWSGHYVSEPWQELYDEIIDYASEVVVVTEADTYPGHWCMHKRNEYMVDHADVVLAYWNGKESGGTFACREYAKKKKKPVTNIYLDPPF